MEGIGVVGYTPYHRLAHHSLLWLGSTHLGWLGGGGGGSGPDAFAGIIVLVGC